jgi:tetratricopeptide (TPR) repeat protein
LAGLALLLAAQAVTPEAQQLIERSPAVASPLEGFLTLGEFFFRHRRYERARQVLAYGLLHAPADARFLGWLGRVELALGRAERARRYALAALETEPGQPMAQEVLSGLSRPSPAASPPASPRPSPGASPAGSPAASPSPAVSASPAPASSLAGSPVPSPAASPGPAASPEPVVPAVSRALAARLVELLEVQDPKAIEALTRPAKPGLDPKVTGDRLAALRVMKTVDAALKIYKLNHPKEEVTKLDLAALAKDKALPGDLDLSRFPPMTLADGKISMEGFGTQDALDGELEEYRGGLEKAARHRERGLLTESHAVLDEMARKYSTDPEVLDRLLRAQMDLSLEFQGARTACRLFLARPRDPRHLFSVALLYYRSSRPEKALELAILLPQTHPGTFYTPAAQALVQLIESGVSHAGIQRLLAEKEKLMAELDAAATASPTPTSSPTPAQSPVPSASGAAPSGSSSSPAPASR